MKPILIVFSLSLLIPSPVKAYPDPILPSFNQGPRAPSLPLEPSAPVIQKQTSECIPPKAVDDVQEGLKYYSGCTLNQFMEITGMIPESSVPMPDSVTLYKFVGRAGDGFFTTRRTCVLQVGVNSGGQIVQGGFQSAAQSYYLNGRGHCLKILRGEKKNRGINVPLKDLY